MMPRRADMPALASAWSNSSRVSECASSGSRQPEGLEVRSPVFRDHRSSARRVSRPASADTAPPARARRATMGRKLAELHQADRRLDVGHPVVVPGLQIVLDDRLATGVPLRRAHVHAVFAQPTEPGRQLAVRR